ncbi:hypothetical protein [Dyella mobilis]|uniref:Lysine-specific metallo-endopeptidase domain-containing protein n=1 Tax=Dyella mobilis TaxID=1849582 RepID=A0ABS2KBC5_9GAMM|nr:hypothetical protein [Dyella mobilis]MBM7128482.1 hypothetical protein [Dyella mobilis]GLQ99617.1 hypothetical protein GCM10007863_40370 [Dyella mobilis]
MRTETAGSSSSYGDYQPPQNKNTDASNQGTGNPLITPGGNGFGPQRHQHQQPSPSAPPQNGAPPNPDDNSAFGSLGTKHYPPPWNSDDFVEKGARVEFKGNYYEAKEDISPATSMGPQTNPGFRPIYRVPQDYLDQKGIGSFQQQLENGDGPIFVSSGAPSLNAKPYDAASSYQKGAIVKYGEFEYIAKQPVPPDPNMPVDPDKDPRYMKLDNTEPPGNTLSTEMVNGKEIKVPISERVQSAVVSAKQTLDNAIKTIDKTPWDAGTTKQMDALFPGISQWPEGRAALKTNWTMQRDKLDNIIKGGFEALKYFHSYEYDNAGGKTAAVAIKDKQQMAFNVNKLQSEFSDPAKLEWTVLHESSHLVDSKDYQYINPDGTGRVKGWPGFEKAQAERRAGQPNWQWGNADSLALGARIMSGQYTAPQPVITISENGN